jgi:ribosome-associated toxin RatA of RatAB toxin-antitoxin module
VLEIDFAMQVSPLAKVFGVMFHEASERQLQLFIKRADSLYGKQ